MELFCRNMLEVLTKEEKKIVEGILVFLTPPSL